MAIKKTPNNIWLGEVLCIWKEEKEFSHSKLGALLSVFILHRSSSGHLSGLISKHSLHICVSGWQLSPISWGFHWTNGRKGVYFLSLLEEGRHLVVLRRGYLDLAYLVWLQHRFELWRPGEAALCSGSWMEKQILMKSGLPFCSLRVCVCCLWVLAARKAVFWGKLKKNLLEIRLCMVKWKRYL